MQARAGPLSDSEYEYEYDETETETFFVNVDLTSYNGLLRKPRRGTANAAAGKGTNDQDADRISSPEGTTNNAKQANPRDEEDGNGDGDGDDENDKDNDEEEGNKPDDDPENTAGRVQIMELHSKNPFVSYHNHIFSCEWADMIGTDMHFGAHEDFESDPMYLRRTEDYSLIAANAIKIVGRKVRLSATTANVSGPSRQSNRAEGSTQASLQSEQLETRSAQVRFLQELMDIKQDKGETDMVRMTFGTKRGKNFEDKITRWAHTDERVNLIHQLNRAALGGDQDAIAKLEDLYTRIDSGGSGDAAEPPTAAVASDTAPSG